MKNMNIKISSRAIKIFALILVLLLGGWAAKTLLFPPNENEKINRVLYAAADAFAEKKTREVAAFLSDDFIAEPRADKETAVAQMRGFFFQVKELQASLELIKHENEKLPGTATEARVLLIAKVSGTIDGTRFQAFGQHGADAVLLFMRKQEEQWLVARARYLDTSDPLKAFQQLHKK